MDSIIDDENAARLSPAQVEQLGELLKGTGVRSLQIETPAGRRFSIRLEDASAPAASRTEAVCAASVGEFLAGYPSRGTPLVQPGDRVAPGDVLGLVRTGLLFAPVTLDPADGRSATITRLLVPPGTLVGYGTPLIEVERQPHAA